MSTTYRTVTTDTAAIYRTVRQLGSLSAVYQAAAEGDPAAQAVLDALKADAQHLSHAFGATACVRAALAAEPYAVASDGVTTVVFG